MIFLKQEVLIYLKRQELEIFVSGKDPLVFVFPPDLVSAEEIKDKEKLQTQLSDFLTSNKLTKLRAVAVLAEELVYQKSISATDPAGINAEKEQFLDEIPFPNEKIVSKFYPDKKLVLAVNGELFKLLINVISGKGGKVLFVAPITFLGVPAVDNNNFQQILYNKNLLKQSNLLNTQDIKRNIDLKLPLILGLAVLLFGGGLFYYFRPAKKVTTITPKAPTQQVTGTKPATDSGKVRMVPTVANPKTKKNFTVKVLNGTGTAGDAKKVKDALEALGFQNIETGNLEKQNATASAVSFTDPVKDQFREEIISALQKLFKSVLESASSPGSFDAVIVTGK